MRRYETITSRFVNIERYTSEKAEKEFGTLSNRKLEIEHSQQFPTMPQENAPMPRAGASSHIAAFNTEYDPLKLRLIREQ